MTFEEIKALLEKHLPDAVVGEDLKASPLVLEVTPAAIYQVCDLLHTHEQCYFDMLSCLTGLDNGPEAGTMEVIYNLYSIPYDHHLMLRVTLERESAEIASVSSIWRTANWHEREAYDMLGIRFLHHPDLRRILLPKDWEGFPLRKDYQGPETYHGMTVAYDRDDTAPDDLTKD
ncbi:NADH-quinone oxidoreductase subunit C [Marinoscillum furvescens]|uniref:NADH-quinone oxidoreductase subunit C n=1 Tax=Marinoscillum furvescens DSM 4134 TaxID=1122208 RepID=A0A3D9L3M4_MARFU|nr:NADH-quinone oxidoreductase subunit C [Marinoscillum furvescens]RED99896.1 NADH dehydrogenase subunit C [Marinoscillum furvescens DSM 4134]